VELKPDWAKGYSRLGAAHHGLREYEQVRITRDTAAPPMTLCALTRLGALPPRAGAAQAFEAFNKGLQIDPSNEQLKSGLADAEDAQARTAAQSTSVCMCVSRATLSALPSCAYGVTTGARAGWRGRHRQPVHCAGRAGQDYGEPGDARIHAAARLRDHVHGAQAHTRSTPLHIALRAHARCLMRACVWGPSQEVQKTPSAANKYINDPRMMQARHAPQLRKTHSQRARRHA
jgi:hypothetical protein